jgi:hypothetical protein
MEKPRAARMKRFSLFRRNGVFYGEDRLEEKQQTLSTRDKAETARLPAAHLEADKRSRPVIIADVSAR